MNRREAFGLFGAGVGLLTRFGETTSVAAAAQRGRAAAPAPGFPAGAVIRTMLKDVAPAALADGAVLVHEHPALAIPDDHDLLVLELQQAQKDGLACIVDGAIRRRTSEQVTYLRQASAKSGMPVVLAGSYYLQPSYPPQIAAMSEDQIADEFVQDAAAQNWGALGEFGTSPEMHPDERKVLRAAAKAHLRTGLPIFTHTPHSSCPKCALEQLDLFESLGVEPRHVVIGHMSAIKPEDDPSSETHKAVAKRGAFVGLDTVGREMSQSFIPEAQKVKLVLRLLDAGYENNLVFSSDFANPKQLKSNWGMGFSTVLTQFLPKLRTAGVKDETLRKITVANPRRFLSFVPRKSS